MIFFKRVRIVVLVVVCLVMLTGLLNGQMRRIGKVQYIVDPKPTHVEKESDYVNLVKTVEIPGEIDDKHFMVWPLAIAAAGDGTFFCYDNKIRKIYKFASNGTLIKIFGTHGQGPGEFSKGRGTALEIYLGKGGILNISDIANRRLMKFNTDGKHIKDYRIPANIMIYQGFFPVITPGENILIRGGIGCTLNAYSIGDMKKQYSILNREKAARQIVTKASPRSAKDRAAVGWMEVFYDVIKDTLHIVYLNRSSTVYIYEKEKLIKQFDLWPQGALDNFRKKTEYKKNSNMRVSSLFVSLLVDKDNENYFYLDMGITEGKGRMLYKFDLDGNLVKILRVPTSMRFHCKRNNTFYATHKDTIILLKEEKHENKVN